jgi:hypothetical protein
MKIEVRSVRLAESDILEAITSPSNARSARRVHSSDQVLSHLLPVDPGFTIDMFTSFNEVKGQDVEFCHRADAALLGMPMPAVQQGANPDDWRTNFDAFVFCDGHAAHRNVGAWVRAACSRPVHEFQF